MSSSEDLCDALWNAVYDVVRVAGSEKRIALLQLISSGFNSAGRMKGAFDMFGRSIFPGELYKHLNVLKDARFISKSGRLYNITESGALFLKFLKSFALHTITKNSELNALLDEVPTDDVLVILPRVAPEIIGSADSGFIKGIKEQLSKSDVESTFLTFIFGLKISGALESPKSFVAGFKTLLESSEIKAWRSDLLGNTTDR